MESSASGQGDPNPGMFLAAQAGKMEQHCSLGIAHFVPAITFRQSLSRCMKIFFRKIFSITVKRFIVNYSIKTVKEL